MIINELEIDITNGRYVFTIGEDMFNSTSFNIKDFVSDKEVETILSVKMMGYHHNKKLFIEILKLLSAKSVENIDISDNSLAEEASIIAKVLKDLSNLKTLDLTGDVLKANASAVLKVLSSSKTLNSVNISENWIKAIDPEARAMVDSCPSLEHVDISGNEHLAELAGVSKFDYVDLL